MERSLEKPLAEAPTAMHLARVALPLLLIGAAACSGPVLPVDPGAPAPKRAADAAGADETGSFGDGTADPQPGPTDAPASEVWSHSYDQLFKLDPTTKAVTLVGSFSGCTGVVDIALDASSNLFATTEPEGGGTMGALWKIDKKTARCTKVASGNFPNSLSFVPKGTVDPNAEALVGYVGGTYVRIDPKTGSIKNIGSLGDAQLESSGDIVSVKGGSTYLTVFGGTCGDCLVEVNPSTGAIVKNWGDINHHDVYGLAFWAGSVYGFDHTGQLFEVTFTGGKLATKTIPIPNGQVGVEFTGAGSTTSAPVTAPR